MKLLRIKRWIRGAWFDWKNRDVPRGYCCCGDLLVDHNYGSGHAPVDEYEYHRDRYMRRSEGERRP